MSQTPANNVVRVRPHRIRVVAWVAAVVVLVAAAALGAALEGTPNAGPQAFGLADRIALAGLGVIAAGALLLLTRPLVEADRRGVRVRNMVGGYTLPWEVVRKIRFDHGASWAVLELHDDEVIGLLAVQAVDKERAVAAVRELRALHAAHSRPAA